MISKKTRKVAAVGVLLLAGLGLGGCVDGLHSYDFSYSESYGHYDDYHHYDHHYHDYHHHGHHGHHHYDHCD